VTIASPGFDVHTANAWDIFGSFLSGDGGTYFFEDGDFFAEQTKKDPFIKGLALQAADDAGAAGYASGVKDKSYKDNTKQGAADFLRGVAGNWEVTAVGSFHVHWYAKKNDDGTSTVTMHFTNAMSNTSIAHFTGYDKSRFGDEVVNVLNARIRCRRSAPTSRFT
jgi:hypothetical protein